MNVIICKNYQQMSIRAADMVANVIKHKPDCVLGLATGSTPVGMYKQMIEKYRAGEIDFSCVTTVNLDEYYPISPDNDRSYRYFMNTVLFDHINIDKANTYLPDGTAADPDEACRAYEELISRVGGVDIQVLGIGQNGHIAFNEPAETLESVTHATDLTESTIRANARFFASEADVPTRALTMGIGTIMRAKKIIILAGDSTKKDAVKAMLSGRLSCACPASMLNLHPDVTLVCDEDAIGDQNS